MAMESSSRLTPWLRTALLLTLTLAGRAQAAATADDLAAKVQAATFEVVIPKPSTDPLSYEKPLPLELIPFQERNDKYYSVGTAFSIGNNQYVTAAHVLNLAVGSLTGAPELRDRDGHVYAIGQITKYSLGRDFAVFSLASAPSTTSALAVDKEPKLNSKVFAVGNALGTGVVIRDGLYTSDTPEDQEGQWKWMRFSAAASPGNSGGPLLDEDGKVIGVVLMKSANENLNFALPIKEVIDAPTGVADIDKRFSYKANFFDAIETATFKAQLPLPASFADFVPAYQKSYNAFFAGLQKSLLEKHAGEIFPRGQGSQKLLHASADMHAFPSIILSDSAGNWSLKNPAHDHRNLSANGYMESGKGSDNVLLTHLRKPDDVTADQLYQDPKRFMDLLLRGWNFNRAVGNENIRITSLGSPTQDFVYTDAYARHWQVRVWPVAFNNIVVLAFSLPVPDGYVTAMEMSPANNLAPALGEMQMQCNFIDAAYDGTLAQWKDFLAQGSLLPGVLSDVHLLFDDGQRFSFRSPGFGLNYPSDPMGLNEKSHMELGFAFSEQGKDARWELADVGVKAQPGDSERFNLSRHVEPADLSAPNAAWWSKLKQRQHPDDETAFNDQGETRIGTLVGQPSDSSKVLYRATYATSITPHVDEVKAKFEQLLKGVTINGS